MWDDVKITISYPSVLISSAISETRLLPVLNLYNILFLHHASLHFLIVSSIASTNGPCTFRFRESRVLDESPTLTDFYLSTSSTTLSNTISASDRFDREIGLLHK
jgi:hypothetical protein